MKIDLSRFSGRFRQETRDNLSQLDTVIARLESSNDSDTNFHDSIIREMMRLVHAIKGGARMLGFSGINLLCHSTEELLISLKDSSEITRNEIDLIVESRKGIDKLLNLTHQDSETPVTEPVWLNALLDKLADRKSRENNGGALPISESGPSKEEKLREDNPTSWKGDNWRDTTVRVDVDSIDDLLYYGRELTQALDGLRKSQVQIDLIRDQIENTLIQRRTKENSSVGLTISETDLLLRSLTKSSFNLRDKIAEVDRNVRQIDSGAVELRMRPISELFETIPLQVRDLAHSLGKEVDVEFSGESVRLDGRIVELLREPMLHLIRNAIDHGLESSDDRISQGKSPHGRLTLGANENAGWARVVIADDGKGIDPETVWRRAVELGLTENNQPQPQEAKTLYHFLFDDRFTTRATASDVSGRGVGLAAVKRRLQELRGNVSIDSIPGMGTRFTLLMPTSLSSQHVLITSTQFFGEHRFYAFPTAMIKGTNRWDHSLEVILDGAGLIRNEETIRAFSLSGLLDRRSVRPNANESYLVICTDGNVSAAIAVERIVAEIEIIIEPLPLIARSAEIIAGAAPLTSDEIALVINVPTLLSTITVSTSSNLKNAI